MNREGESFTPEYVDLQMGLEHILQKSSLKYLWCGVKNSNYAPWVVGGPKYVIVKNNIKKLNFALSGSVCLVD